MGAVFESILNSGFNFTLLQSNGNIEYFIDKLKIWETSLAKTAALSFKNLPDRLSRAGASRGNEGKVTKGRWLSKNVIQISTFIQYSIMILWALSFLKAPSYFHCYFNLHFKSLNNIRYNQQQMLTLTKKSWKSTFIFYRDYKQLSRYPKIRQ